MSEDIGKNALDTDTTANTPEALLDIHIQPSVLWQGVDSSFKIISETPRLAALSPSVSIIYGLAKTDNQFSGFARKIIENLEVLYNTRISPTPSMGRLPEVEVTNEQAIENLRSAGLAIPDKLLDEYIADLPEVASVISAIKIDDHPLKALSLVKEFQNDLSNELRTVRSYTIAEEILKRYLPGIPFPKYPLVYLTEWSQEGGAQTTSRLRQFHLLRNRNKIRSIFEYRQDLLNEEVSLDEVNTADCYRYFHELAHASFVEFFDYKDFNKFDEGVENVDTSLWTALTEGYAVLNERAGVKLIDQIYDEKNIHNLGSAYTAFERRNERFKNIYKAGEHDNTSMYLDGFMIMRKLLSSNGWLALPNDIQISKVANILKEIDIHKIIRMQPDSDLYQKILNDPNKYLQKVFKQREV